MMRLLKQSNTSEWGRWALNLMLLAAVAATAAAAQNWSGRDRFSIAAELSPYRIELHRFRLEESPQSLHVGFNLHWVSRDGMWAGGKKFGNVFDRSPLCLYVQNVKTAERRSYCGLLDEAQRFAFSDDLQSLAVLGRLHKEGGGQDPVGLFVINLAHPARGPEFVLQNLEKTYVAGLSFTHDGRLLTFARGNDMFSFDLRSRVLKALGPGANPAMSPSGSHLCFQDSSDRLILREVGSSTEFLVGETIGYEVTWSPDGRGILYCRPYHDAKGGNAELVVYDLTSKAIEVLGQIHTLGGEYWWVVR